MKKLTSFILALSLCFLLAACGTDTESTTIPTADPTDTPTAQPTTVPTEPVIPETTAPSVSDVEYDLPMTAVSMTQQTEVTNGKSGTTEFEYTYQNIRLVLPDAELSMSVNLDILNRIDATRANATDLMNDAVAADPQYPYSLSVIYEPQRVDSAVLSLYQRQSVYSGGSTIHSGAGLTYDLTTGNVLTLADVLADGVTADVICPLVIDALNALPEEYYIFEDFANVVEERFAENFLTDTGWHLSDEGLCFTFLPYEVAPNSTGYVHAVIPYEKLTGILNDSWFPVERISPAGTLEILPFTQEDADRFDQFAELYLDRDGGSYLIHATGLVYDVVIEQGFWNSDGTVFTPEQTVFTAGSLVSADALMIRADLPDSLPSLRITYTGPEGTITVYPAIGSGDGTPLFLTN